MKKNKRNYAGRYCAAQMFDYLTFQESGCIEWTGMLDKFGYGRVRWLGRTVMVHRVFYQLEIGAIPASLVVDHVCKNTRCVNTSHLELVTQLENVTYPRRFIPVKTHCKAGHEYSQENTYWMPKGAGRDCRKCLAAASKRYRSRINQPEVHQ